MSWVDLYINENKVLIQRHTVYSFDFPIISRVRCFEAASNLGRLIFKGGTIVGLLLELSEEV